jgi:hypothetical protein
MDRSILISLVSAQTIPNVLLIKALPKFDKYVLLSSKEMEKENESRSKCIVDTCGLELDHYEVKEVIEDNLSDIKRKLKSLKLNKTNKITVNITGGTKIMTLGIYDFFNDWPNTNFLYKHIKHYYFQELEKDNRVLIPTKLNTKDYLLAYGISFKDKEPNKSENYTNAFYSLFLESKIDMEIIENLRIHYRGKKKKHLITAIESAEEETESEKGKRIPNLGEFLSEIHFPYEEDQKITKSEIDYLTGGWFEEYIYHQVKRKLPEADVLLGVNLKKGSRSNPNDLDVVFCMNDILGVIECKTSLLLDGKYTQLFNETIYKAGALKQNFGLSVRSYLFCLDDFQDKFFELKDKAKILGITLAHRPDFETIERILPTA